MKYVLAALAILAFGLPVAGREAFSYLYIQGDKQTPFYVKLEEAMQPRYGKNYCIIPQLASGPAHIEILFQQNAFPAQKFTVLIPENGSREFLLVKKDEAFSLYDLQQGFYLPADNSDSEDHLPNAVAGNAASLPEIPTIENQERRENPAIALKKIVRKEKPERRPAQIKHPPVVRKTDPAKDGPAFIPGMELSKATERSDSPSVQTSPKPGVAITNSDCPAPISAAEFSKIFSAMSANGTDEERLSYVLGKMDVCYESWQARALTQMLTGDAARYTLLKRIFPRITDQAAFPLLDDLLTAEAWKTEFSRLTHH